VNSRGENEILVALGASAHLETVDIRDALIQGAKVVICQHEANLLVNQHAFGVARQAAVCTVLNPAPMRPDFDPAILALTDVLIPNESEFVALVEMMPACASLLPKARGGASGRLGEAALNALHPVDLHRLCRALRVPTVVVTLGKRGCFVSLADGSYVLVAGHTGLDVVDTTGAGDAFVGGFAAGYVLSKGDLVAAARHGNAVAALSVTKFGTAPSMPGAKEIKKFLRGRAAS
jgi:ribokinase